MGQAALLGRRRGADLGGGRWSRVGGRQQGQAPYFAVFEAEWDDAEAMVASLNSPEGQAVAADMAPFVTEGTVHLNYTPQDFLSSSQIL